MSTQREGLLRASRRLSSCRVPSRVICRRCHSTIPPPPPKRFRWPFPLGLSIALLPGLYWYLGGSKPSLNPQLYTTQTIASTSTIAPSHKLVSIAIPPSASDHFKNPYKRDGTRAEEGEIVVQHMMIGAPDIQIERPYTPVNDPVADGNVKMVVKRVRGGEVGRLVHSLQEGQNVEMRGPIPTFAIKPQEFDRIVMISTGTGVAPFLQLLSRLPSSENQSTPDLHLVHMQPNPGKEDWAEQGGFISALQQKFGKRLRVHRPEPTPISRETMKGVLETGSTVEKVMILVCLPPHYMYPLCGGLTRMLEQGPLTGLLADMGLKEDQVFKLE